MCLQDSNGSLHKGTNNTLIRPVLGTGPGSSTQAWLGGDAEQETLTQSSDRTGETRDLRDHPRSGGKVPRVS